MSFGCQTKYGAERVWFRTDLEHGNRRLHLH